jgi:hypothetical protein
MLQPDKSCLQSWLGFKCIYYLSCLIEYIIWMVEQYGQDYVGSAEFLFYKYEYNFSILFYALDLI